MDYENESAKKLQDEAPPRQKSSSQAINRQIKMFVSTWYTDELGNQARIIKARD
jgi:hypothetical protein